MSYFNTGGFSYRGKSLSPSRSSAGLGALRRILGGTSCTNGSSGTSPQGVQGSGGLDAGGVDLLASRHAVARFEDLNECLLLAGESNKLLIKQVLRGRNKMTGTSQPLMVRHAHHERLVRLGLIEGG